MHAVSYGSAGYGGAEYGGWLGGRVAEAPPSAHVQSQFVVGSEDRTLIIRRQNDPVVNYEDRRIIAMPSAIVELRTFVKDPEAYKPYSVDWSELLEAEETITNSGWSASGLSATGGQINGAVCTVKLGGGTLGQIYLVENSIQTSLGRRYTRGFLVMIERT